MKAFQTSTCFVCDAALEAAFTGALQNGLCAECQRKLRVKTDYAFRNVSRDLRVGYGQRKRRRSWLMTPIGELVILVCGVVIGAACRDIFRIMGWWP